MPYKRYQLVKRFCEELGGNLIPRWTGIHNLFSCSVELKTKEDYEKFAKFLGMEYAKGLGLDMHILKTPLETAFLEIPEGSTVEVKFSEYDVDFRSGKEVTLSMEADLRSEGANSMPVGRLYIDSKRKLLEDGKRSKPLTVVISLQTIERPFQLSARADIEAERKELPQYREKIWKLIHKKK